MDRRTLFKLTGISLGTLATQSLPISAAAKSTAELSAAEILPSKDRPLLLNFNENSIGMSPHAIRAIQKTLPIGYRYPDDQRAALIENIARHYQIKEDSISLGNGSSENIQAIVQAMIQRAHNKQRAIQVVVPDPTFNYAELYAESSAVAVKKIPLRDDMHFDIAAMQQAAAEFEGDTLFYLCNPNNPTAMITEGKVLHNWIKKAAKNQFFLIDEAYAEFATDPAFVSAVQWVKKGMKNLAVTRTFSKLYALAGLRVGYALAAPEVIKECEAFMSIDNTNLCAAIAANVSIQDAAFRKNSVETINQSRKIVENALNELGLKSAPSQANFIFHEVKGDMAKYKERMKEAHVFVGREFPPLSGWNRLTLGTPAEMKAFVKILKQFREKDWI